MPIVIPPAAIQKFKEAQTAEALHTALSELALPKVFRPGIVETTSEGAVTAYRRSDGHWTFMKSEGSRSAGVAIRTEKVQGIFSADIGDFEAVFGPGAKPLRVAKKLISAVLLARSSRPAK